MYIYTYSQLFFFRVADELAIGLQFFTIITGSRYDNEELHPGHVSLHVCIYSTLGPVLQFFNIITGSRYDNQELHPGPASLHVCIYITLGPSNTPTLETSSLAQTSGLGPAQEVAGALQDPAQDVAGALQDPAQEVAGAVVSSNWVSILHHYNGIPL